MVAFVASLMDAGGHFPMIGDADDGHVLRLSAEQGFSAGRSLIATGAVLFNRSDLATRAARYDDKSAWLLASEAGEASFRGLLEANAQPHVPKTSFPHSGYYLLGSDFGADHEVRLLADAGPLGYLSIAAHGHADALAILLSVGGEEVLVDPGTYCYQAEPEWRAYFRGTSAHNTITVDGEDQSVQAGSFLWSRHAHALCTRFDPGLPRQVFSGEHHGYRRLKDPVIHSRTISYDARGKEFQVEDILSCEGAHEVVRHWHFAEPLSPERREGEWQVRTKTALICLSPQETLEGHEALRGSADPFGGWVSRAFATKMPATTLRWKNLIQGTTVLTTRIKYRFDA